MPARDYGREDELWGRELCLRPPPQAATLVPGRSLPPRTARSPLRGPFAHLHRSASPFVLVHPRRGAGDRVREGTSPGRSRPFETRALLASQRAPPQSFPDAPFSLLVGDGSNPDLPWRAGNSQHVRTKAEREPYETRAWAAHPLPMTYIRPATGLHRSIKLGRTRPDTAEPRDEAVARRGRPLPFLQLAPRGGGCKVCALLQPRNGDEFCRNLAHSDEDLAPGVRQTGPRSSCCLQRAVPRYVTRRLRRGRRGWSRKEGARTWGAWRQHNERPPGCVGAAISERTLRLQKYCISSTRASVPDVCVVSRALTVSKSRAVSARTNQAGRPRVAAA